MTFEDDWEDADSGTWTALLSELEMEVSPGHPLHGKSCSIVARRRSQDDIVLVVDGHPGCASVHLTWRGAADVVPYPRTQWHASVTAAKASLDDSRIWIVDDVLIDEAGERWGFDFVIGWRSDVDELVSEVRPLRVVSGQRPDRDLSLSALEQMPKSATGGVYRSESGCIVYVRSSEVHA